MELGDLELVKRIDLNPRDALLVVDMQDDFMPGGALSVSEGDTIVPGVNAVMRLFSGLSLPIVLTQDWHPVGHRSFASAHTGKKPFDLHRCLALDYCVFFTASHGADLGYKVVLLTDLAKPVGSPPDSISQALKTMKTKGVEFAISSAFMH